MRRYLRTKSLLAQQTLSDIDKPNLAGFDQIFTRLIKMRILVNCYAKLCRTSFAERKSTGGDNTHPAIEAPTGTNPPSELKTDPPTPLAQ